MASFSNNNRVVVFDQDLEPGADGGGGENDSSSEISSGLTSIVGPLPSSPSGEFNENDNISTNSSIRNYSGNGNIDSTNSSSSGATLKKAKNVLYPRRSSNASGMSKQSNNSTGNDSGGTRSTNESHSIGGTSSGSSSSGLGSFGGSGHYTAQAKATPRPVWLGRWLFLTLLLVVAGALGYMTYSLLTGNETLLTDCVFEKVATNAIDNIRNNQDRKMLGMCTMGTAIGK
jgi:hypothetical protein